MKGPIIAGLLVFSLSCESPVDEKDNSGIGIIGTSGLDEHNFNAALFDSIEQRIINDDFGNINSLLIIHQDELVCERYYRNWERGDLHYIASDTKSVTSLVFGIARDNGSIPSLNEKVISIFSEFDIQNIDERKEAITIESLLTMSAGFEWNEWIPYTDPENSNTLLKASDNWIRFTLNKPMADDPGSTFVYNSGVSILLGELVRIKTGKYIVDLAVEELFGPLDISTFFWDSKNGVADCGGGLYMRPIDLAKIGYLVLNNGKWANKRIISEEWIDESFRDKIYAVPRFNYGYQWWNFESPLGILHDIGHASGHGDQYVFIIEDLDMVIVVTAENYDNETKQSAYDLLFALFSIDPDYVAKVYEKYDWIESIEIQDYDYPDIDYMNIAWELIAYSEYDKAINVLDKLSEEENNTDWYYCFLYGKAYYHLGDRDNAVFYLNRHIQYNGRNNPHEQYFYDTAIQMLEDME